MAPQPLTKEILTSPPPNPDSIHFLPQWNETRIRVTLEIIQIETEQHTFQSAVGY